jgi:hypothetical protein
MALSTELICVFLKEIEAKIAEATSFRELNRWVMLGVYSVITCVISLSGSEVFLLDLGGLGKHQVDCEQQPSYFLIPLTGKVKGEHHDH